MGHLFAPCLLIPLLFGFSAQVNSSIVLTYKPFNVLIY